MDAEEDFEPLKLDRSALERGRIALIEEALATVWGETTRPLPLGWIEAGVVLWAAQNRRPEPVKEARDIMVEAASLGLIVKRGGRWNRPSKRRRGGRNPD